MKKFILGVGVCALALCMTVASCVTAGSNSGTPETLETPGPLNSLLRTELSEVQIWGEGNKDERDVTVYSFNPEIKDELIQAVKDDGFFQSWSGEYTRDWDLTRGVLRWCVPSNTEKWDCEIQFSAIGETTVHTYGFNRVPTPLVSIDNWNGHTGFVEVGVPVSLVGRGTPTAAFWHWINDDETTFETFDWSVKDAGGTGATITGNIIHATAPGTVIVTASVPDGAGIGIPFTKDWILQVAGPKVTKGDYVVREFNPGWLLDKYSGKEKNVAIPASLGITVIGRNAFRWSQITSINIPEGVTEILLESFWECPNLQSITFPSTLRIIENAFQRLPRLETVNIPYGVTTIREWAFNKCEKLTSVTIPASVTTIGENVFANCTGLTSLTIQAVQPPRMEGNLWDYWNKDTILPKKLTGIYVPAASVNTYKNADVWKWDEYRDLIKPIE
ncbi:hypothetical protein FACS1894147_03480 [Spirochaetia bacterium]|nr:hypothetical protein FACS1894147_03480 [Spirochaetia bacterium]